MGSSEKKIGLFIGGMTCVNCQNKIEKKLKGTPGIVSASVSYNKGIADIVYDEKKISLKKIISIIEKLYYEVLSGKQGTDVKRTACLLAAIAGLYVILQRLGLLNLLAPSQLADTKMGYGMLFVIGLITSVHCIAMCGGINISQCIPQGAAQGEESGWWAAFRPALAYNLGRVCSYTAVGFVLGMAGFLIGGGSEVGLSVFFQGLMKIIAGLLMIIMGINMLGLFPGLRRFTIRVPGFLARGIGERKRKSSRPFFVGILNGFMPCGPLQSMWIVALASGNPFSGALSMLLFSLGTVPLMLGLGSIVSVLGKKFTDKVMTVGAVLVVVLGLAMLSQGGSLSGWLPPDLLMILLLALCAAGVVLSIPVQKKLWMSVRNAGALTVVVAACVLWRFQGPVPESATAAGTEMVEGVQVVNSTLTAGRYPNITVRSGVPVKWVIDAPEGSVNGCNYKLLIRDYGIEHTFQTGENVIEFTPEKAGTIRYSCWMGMIYGNIFVTDGTEEANEAPRGDVTVPTPAGYTIPADSIATASLTEDGSGNEFQEVSVALTEEGFSPAIVVVRRDTPVIWNIENKLGNAVDGTTLLAPYYSTRLVLGEGINQLSLYPSESFDVSTEDHRFYCYVKVVEDLGALDEAAIRQEVAAYEPLIYPPEIFESPGMSCCG